VTRDSQHPFERGDRDARPHDALDDRAMPADASLDDEPALTLDALRLPAPLRAARLAALAARIDAAAAPELARRAAPSRLARTRWYVASPDDATTLLARALRPSLLAAAAALLLAIALGRTSDAAGSVQTTRDPIAGQLVADAAIAEALAVDSQDAEWIAQRDVPSDDELLRAIGYGGVK